MPKSSVQARAQGGNGNGAAALFDSPVMGAINPFTMFTINMAGATNDPVPVWSYYPQIRDIYLRVLSKQEPIMASALYNMTSRIKSLRWSIPRGGRNDKKYYQSLFAEADGGEGYGNFISKVVTDFLSQDNGAFIELVGAGKEDRPLVGKVKEVWHMDSAQCWRTFDPEYPVIYIDPLDNSYHRMHRTRVIRLSSFPQPDERARNIGVCAVSRALKLMQTMRNVQTFRDEKITGKFNRGLIYGSGATSKQFDQAVEKAEQVAESMNFTVYKDIPVLLSMMPGLTLDILNIASLPDGFDYEKEITLYVYCLALAFGTDAREFWPATSSGATKADATVQHMKAQGKGQADIIKSIETAFGWHVMPSNGKATFEYDFTDDEQDKLVAELQGVKAANIEVYQRNQWITPIEGRALAIHEGLIDPKALENIIAPEIAEDDSPIDSDTPADELSDAGDAGMDEFDFDPLGGGMKAAPIKYEESKHSRDSSGRFGSGGGTPTTPAPATTPAPTEQIGVSPGGQRFKLTPLADRLKAFLGILNQAGSYKDGELLIKRTKRDRTKDLEKYLHNKGFPNAKVTARRTQKGMVYSINAGESAAPIKRKRGGRKKGSKNKPKVAAMQAKALNAVVNRKDSSLENYIAAYQSALDNLYDDFIAGVVSDPADYDSALDDLYDEFLNAMPVYLTTGFGVGLQGDEPTTEGIESLTNVGQTSADFFHDSLMPAIRNLGLAALTEREIRAVLEALRARVLMYAGAMWEAIWRGLQDRTDDNLRIRRILEDGAEHCDTCPGKAKEYDSFEDMVAESGLPGDGSDPCLSNCRCSILVETAVGSGEFGSIAGSPTVFVTPLFEVLRNGR